MGHGDRRLPVFRSGVVGFLGCSNWWWVWWRSMWVTKISVGHGEVNVSRFLLWGWVSVVRLGFCWRVRCCWVPVVTLVFFSFFFFFNMGFSSSGILVGSGQWWHGGHGGGAVVVTKQWRRSDKGRRKVEKQKRKNIFYCIDILF